MMKSNSRFLGGTALAALASALIFAATPTLAQQDQAGGPGPTASQPATNSQPGSATSQTRPGVQAGPATGQATAPAGPPPSSTDTPPSSMGTSSSATMSASTGEPLSKVKNAKQTLASASVQDSSGLPIGQVSTVHTTKHGTPIKVDIMLNPGNGSQAKTVTLKASQLSYDSSSDTLKAGLTASDITALPSATTLGM